MAQKLKDTVQKQHRTKVNEAARRAGFDQPKGGWIKLVRESIGMSGVQLGMRVGVGRSRVSRLEKAEAEGSITLKSLREAAEAMNCKLVYAIVPEESIEAVIERQAEKKARAIVKVAATHMALEDQSLGKNQLIERVQDLKNKLMYGNSKELWDG